MDGFKAKQFIPCRYNRCRTISPVTGYERVSRLCLRIKDDHGRELERPVYECENPRCPASRNGSDAPIYPNMVGSYAHEDYRTPGRTLRDGDTPDDLYRETAI